MSYPAQEQVQSILRLAEQREVKARRRAVLYSLVPVALAFLLFFAAFWAVREAERRVKQFEQKVNELQKQIEQLKVELEATSESLRRTTDFRQYAFAGNIAYTLKRLHGSRGYESQAALLSDILRMQSDRVRWRRGGESPSEGFDSPGFVAYMLHTHSLLPERPSAVHYRLREALDSAVEPQIGDVVFYPGGYTMFYFKDEDDRPFVIGMTPEGIFALRYNFAPVLGHGKVNYR